MKLIQEDNQLITNSQNESGFTIQATAKTFALLSDKIYTHKIAAVVREISWNAYDSHTEAGKSDKPIEVTFPNVIDPTFSIEDFGLGLDDDDVRNIYTVYGNSTKNDSNDLTGALGIGSKSPFAYTKTFTITARKDGIERIYNAYIGPEGSPLINMIGEMETDECNGVKVAIPVMEDDFDKFEAEAAFIFSFFEVAPTTFGLGYDLELDHPGIMHKLNEERFVLVDRVHSESSLYNNNIYAVMGGVCYAVNKHDLIDKDQDETMIDRFLENKQLFIKFEMATLDFVPSREQLSMDEMTTKNLREQFGAILSEYLAEEQAKIDAMSKPIAWCYLEAHHISKYRYGYGNQKTTRHNFKWRGKPMDGWPNKILFKGMSVVKKFHRDRPMAAKGFGISLNKLLIATNEKWKNPTFEKKVVFLYVPEGTPTRGLQKVLGMLTSDSSDFRYDYRHHLTYAFQTPISEHKRSRMVALTKDMPIEWISLPEIMVEVKAFDKAARDARKAEQGAVDATVYGAAEVECKQSFYLRQDGPSKLNDLTETDTTFMYVKADEREHGTDDNCQRLFKVVKKLEMQQDRKLIVLWANTRNLKKIQDNGILEYREALKILVEKHIDKIKANHLGNCFFTYENANGYNTWDRKHSSAYRANGLARLIRIINPGLYKEIVVGMNNKFIGDNDLHYINFHDISFEMEQLEVWVENIKQKINAKYPMIDIDEDDLEYRPRVRDYVNLINFSKFCSITI